MQFFIDTANVDEIRAANGMCVTAKRKIKTFK